MKNHRVLVIGGSAGSLDVLLKVLPEINSNLDFPIIIVLHRKQGADSLLSDLLSYRTELKVKEAGRARLEGKDYIMQDGDICYFRFNK